MKIWLLACQIKIIILNSSLIIGFQWMNFIEDFLSFGLKEKIFFQKFIKVQKYKVKNAYRYKFEFNLNKKYCLFLKVGWI